jgi:hypothetical protein
MEVHYRNYRSWHSRSIAPLKDLVYSSTEESIPIPDYDWKCPACGYHNRYEDSFSKMSL